MCWGVQVKVFWVVMLCIVVAGYKHFGGCYCLHLHPRTVVSYHNTSWCYNPEDLDLNLHHCENLISCMLELVSCIQCVCSRNLNHLLFTKAEMNRRMFVNVKLYHLYLEHYIILKLL